MRFRSALTTAATGVTVATALGLASPAQATTNPYTARGLCGPSYTVTVATHALTGTTATANIYLLYSPSLGENCVVTLKTSKLGSPTFVNAAVQLVGGTWIQDPSYSDKYYAGPIRVYAPHTCVQYFGATDISYTSGPVGCD